MTVTPEQVAAVAGSAPWYRKPLCWAGMCATFSPASDDTGCWGECSICHKRVGFVDRAALRRFADAEASAHLHSTERQT